MKRILRQICSIVLCALMILGLSAPGVAALAADTPKGQIGNHFEADDHTGKLSETPRLAEDTSKSYADDWLRTNKTIFPGERENEFLITLDVRTKSEIQNIELSEDAAVVLVIDLSGSMKEDNRLEKAKQAALEFIEKFAVTDNENTLRKIAVVGFSGQQEISGGWWGSPRQKGIVAATTYQPWTEATDASISSTIEEMKAEGGTCLQAGLILAKNLLNSDEVANIANKNIIVLTDGCPTYYLTDTAASDSSDDSIGKPETIRGSGSETDHNTHTKTEASAKDILGAGIHVYGIYLGNDTISCSNDRSCKIKNKTGAAWLRENCGFITYAVENAGDLSNIFENISELIRLQAKAWIAEDPMGEPFDFAGFEKDPENENEYFYNAADKKIQWNLRLSTPNDTTEDGFSIYRLTYRVRLNTLAPDFTAGVYYPTNGITSVTWLIEKHTESGVSEIDNGTAYFNVPSAKGYAADISFRKTDGNGQPLAGAEFGLYHGESLIDSAISDSDGEVLFENVPSGHSYTILEILAPEGFVASNEKYNIKISYGNLIGTIGEDNTVINFPERKYGGLTVSKTISGAGANPEDEFAFTVALSDAGINGIYGDLEFTDGVSRFILKSGESVTASGLPAGTGYTVTEIEAEGYIPYVNGESGSTTTGTIPSDDIAFAAFHNFYEGGRIDPEPEYGGFILSKTISGDGASQTDEFAFTVTLDNAEINGNYGNINFINGVAAFTLKGGESVTASELPAGTGYTVTENDSKGYAVTVNGESKSSITGVIETDKLAEIAFHNYKAGEPAHNTGSVKVAKTVTGNKAPAEGIPYSFMAWIHDNSGDFVSESVSYSLIKADGTTASGTTVIGEDGYAFSLRDGEGILFSDITEGRRFEVQEITTGDFSVAVIGLSDGFCTISPNVINEVEFVNDYGDDTPHIETGSLTVEKYIHDDDRDMVAKAFTFEVTLTQPDDTVLNEDELDAIKCDKQDIEDEDFHLNWGKTADGNDLTATFTLKHGEKVVIEGIPDGAVYKVAEVDTAGYYLEHVADNPDDKPGEDGSYLAVDRTDNSVNGVIAKGEKTYRLFNNAKPPIIPFTGESGVWIFYTLGAISLLTSFVIFAGCHKKTRRPYHTSAF